MNTPTPQAASGLSIETVSGPEAEAALPALAWLRIEVFRAFPYLYEGNEAYERNYLRTYVKVPGAAIVLAKDGNRIVGASTCLPLAAETENIQKPFRETGMDVSRIFYFGESVLLPEYRGRGAGEGLRDHLFLRCAAPGGSSLAPEGLCAAG